MPVLFTWPSRGQALSYFYDRESANYSRDALEAVLQAIVKDLRVSEVSVLAHSLGNFVAVEAIRQMAIRNHGLSPKIKDIMLASPDIDVDVFRRQIAEIETTTSRRRSPCSFLRTIARWAFPSWWRATNRVWARSIRIRTVPRHAGARARSRGRSHHFCFRRRDQSQQIRLECGRAPDRRASRAGPAAQRRQVEPRRDDRRDRDQRGERGGQDDGDRGRSAVRRSSRRTKSTMPATRSRLFNRRPQDLHGAPASR